MKINIGCDLVCLSRFKKSLQSKKFVERIFTEEEQMYCNAKKDKVSSFAARFAAKEAFAKALGTGLFAQDIAPKDIWIQNNLNRKPQIFVSDKLKKILKKRKVTDWDISLSHHGDYAIAYAIIMYKK